MSSPSFFATFIPIWTDLVSKVATTSNIRFDKALNEAVNKVLQDSFSNGYVELPANLNSPDYLRKNMFESNIARFAAAKTHRQVLELNRIKNKAVDYNDFITQATALNSKYNNGWMKAEYDTAYATGQTSADYYQQIDSMEYFPYGMFDTTGDGNVRDDHKALDGTTFKMGSAEHNLLNPPLGYNCRCKIRPLTEDEVSVKKIKSKNEIISTLEKQKVGKQSTYDIMTKYGFDKNKATTFAVFNSDQYVKAFKESGLNYKDYGISSYNDLRNGLPHFNVSNSYNPTVWFNDRIGGNGLSKTNEIRLLDYRKRPVLWNKKHLTTSDPDSVFNALQSPDEVWLVKEKTGYTKTYLKFYSNQSTVVKTSFDKSLNESIVKTDFVKDADALRKGVKVN